MCSIWKCSPELIVTVARSISQQSIYPASVGVSNGCVRVIGYDLVYPSSGQQRVNFKAYSAVDEPYRQQI